MEIVNPALATSQDAPPPSTDDRADDPDDPGRPLPRCHGGGAPWFDHQNLRDDRAEAFARYLPAGVFDYSYVAQATTPGEFVVPPTRAEEIYRPETFGRAATDRVVVG